MSFANPRDALRAFAKGPADASRRRKRFFARIRSAAFLLAHARAPSPPFPFARIRPAREMELPESAMYVPACNPSSNRLLIVRATTIDPTAFADRFNAQWTASMLWTEAPDPCARGVGGRLDALRLMYAPRPLRAGRWGRARRRARCPPAPRPLRAGRWGNGTRIRAAYNCRTLRAGRWVKRRQSRNIPCEPYARGVGTLIQWAGRFDAPRVPCARGVGGENRMKQNSNENSSPARTGRWSAKQCVPHGRQRSNPTRAGRWSAKQCVPHGRQRSNPTRTGRWHNSMSAKLLPAARTPRVRGVEVLNHYDTDNRTVRTPRARGVGAENSSLKAEFGVEPHTRGALVDGREIVEDAKGSNPTRAGRCAQPTN